MRTNSPLETVIFNLKNARNIKTSDLRSIGYYKIKHGVLQKLNFSKYFRFESADILCDQFKKFVNTLGKEKEETDDTYPWLQKAKERRNM